MGDERISEHGLRRLARRVGGFHELDAAALAAPTRMDLRFHRTDGFADLAVRSGGLFGRDGQPPLGCRDAVATKNFLRLVFVKVHWVAPRPPPCRWAGCPPPCWAA